MHSTFGPAFSRGHLSRHERQELARAEAFSRRTASLALVASGQTLAADELELIRRLVRHDRTAVSTALLVIAGIGGAESRRHAVLSQLLDEARTARADGAIGSRRADQIARHAGRELGRVDRSIAA